MLRLLKAPWGVFFFSMASRHGSVKLKVVSSRSPKPHAPSEDSVHSDPLLIGSVTLCPQELVALDDRGYADSPSFLRNTPDYFALALHTYDRPTAEFSRQLHDKLKLAARVESLVKPEEDPTMADVACLSYLSLPRILRRANA